VVVECESQYDKKLPLYNEALEGLAVRFVEAVN
jgi:hypothetical protein